jgi:uncharacterized YigZ family protein
MVTYLVPARKTRTEITVVNSRFIASAAPVFTVEQAKIFITSVKAEFSDASHNVPAFVIGHGASLITHCNDDGEPAGTAGRPVLAVLSGSGLGDIGVVVTRYFGGTKLGTGGLVRAYSEAVRTLLDTLPLAEKVTAHKIQIAVPYNWFERLQFLIQSNNGVIIDQDFAVDITVTAQFSVDQYTAFKNALATASHGSLQATIIQTAEVVLPR